MCTAKGPTNPATQTEEPIGLPAQQGLTSYATESTRELGSSKAARGVTGDCGHSMTFYAAARPLWLYRIKLDHPRTQMQARSNQALCARLRLGSRAPPASGADRGSNGHVFVDWSISPSRLIVPAEPQNDLHQKHYDQQYGERGYRRKPVEPPPHPGAHNGR